MIQIKPDKWMVERTSGKIEVVEEFTYIPAHEREKIQEGFTASDILTILDRIETALLKGGNAAGFEEIENIENELRETPGVNLNNNTTEGENRKCGMS